MPGTIEVAEIKAQKDRIEYKILDKSGKKLFKKPEVKAWIQYYNADALGFSFDGIPESVLAVPITLYLLPATYFYGVELRVSSVDKTLYENIDSIYEAYSKIYGPFKKEWRGTLVAERIEENKTPASQYEKIVFFSGGVDAVHAGVNNTGEKNVLVSVPSIEAMSKKKGKSPDAGRDFVEVKTRVMREFSAMFKNPWLLITNNFRADIFDDDRIQKELKEKFLLSSAAFKFDGWFGIKYLGNMCSAAPFAFKTGIKSLMLGSAYEEFENKPAWNADGAAPELSDAIRFAGVSFAKQDGYSTRRSQKVLNIVAACRTLPEGKGSTKPALRVCFDDSTVQCGKCIKCVRTQLNILCAKENPRDWGFALFDEKKISRRVRAFRYKETNPCWVWDIVDAIDADTKYPYCDELLHWLKETGYKKYFAKAAARQKRMRYLRIFKIHRYLHYIAVIFKKIFKTSEELNSKL